MSAPRLRAKLATAAPTASEPSPTEEKKDGKGKAEGQPTEEKKDGKGKADEGEQDKKDETGASAAKPPVGASGEKARMWAITQSANGKVFPNLAAAIAYSTDLSAEGAASLFEAVLQDVDTSAVEAPAAREAADSPKGDAFRKAMNAEAPNPKLGAGGGPAAEEDELVKALRAAGLHRDSKD
ncbi:hypothetical protein [Methylobacterium indicum]|uniref:Uncharacterized protein n=1 Tax=Methylobacterium indicum TaxID=1775910 RepID=A0A8H8WSM4_9HYPH|nr:hypothetical protein [Methylobacterium indicum]BCM83587.1 hypothetical protein mvi_20480 [Methylobacterium indicum]